MTIYVKEEELRELEKYDDHKIHSPYYNRTDIVEAYLPIGHYERCRHLFYECLNLKIVHGDG